MQVLVDLSAELMAELSFPLRSAFLALPLEQEAKWQWQALQEELRAHEDVLRFQNPQTPHLTLQFWKELMEIEYQPVRNQAQKIAAATAAFTLQVTEASTFGKRGDERVLLLEIAFSEELARLKKACPWPDPREFRPHITLARMKHPQKFATRKKKIMKVLEDCSFSVSVDRLRLYAEVEGRKQTPLEDFVFSA